MTAKFIQITCSASQAADEDPVENLYALDEAGSVWWYYNGMEGIGKMPARSAEWRPLPQRRRMVTSQEDLIQQIKAKLDGVRVIVNQKGIAPRSENYPLGGGRGYQELETVEFTTIKVLEEVLRMIAEPPPVRTDTTGKDNA